MPDFSCYITIDNTQGHFDLILEASDATMGTWNQPPPPTIARGETVDFTLNDDLGTEGSEGRVIYSYTDASGQRKELAFTFTCPFPFWSANKASGPTFRARSGDGGWGGPNQVPSGGHPLYVKFSL